MKFHNPDNLTKESALRLFFSSAFELQTPNFVRCNFKKVDQLAKLNFVVSIQFDNDFLLYCNKSLYIDESPR